MSEGPVTGPAARFTVTVWDGYVDATAHFGSDVRHRISEPVTASDAVGALTYWGMNEAGADDLVRHVARKEPGTEPT
jgi:hypothetical protein